MPKRIRNVRNFFVTVDHPDIRRPVCTGPVGDGEMLITVNMKAGGEVSEDRGVVVHCYVDAEGLLHVAVRSLDGYRTFHNFVSVP